MPTQQPRLAKLLGYDFAIEYKKGTENSIADPFHAVSSTCILYWQLRQIYGSGQLVHDSKQGDEQYEEGTMVNKEMNSILWDQDEIMLFALAHCKGT